MPHFVISNFASGMDKRRSPETAASGSLRKLRNAFINEGGEIEKRKAFVQQADLTGYGQDAAFKGKIAGPFPCPGARDAVFFRHREDSLPSGFSAGAGSIAAYVQDVDAATSRVLHTFWVQKSTLALPGVQALLHGASGSEFSSTFYAVESHVLSDLSRDFQHVEVTFTGTEPTSEAEVAANDGRAFQRVLKNKGYVTSGRTLYGSAVGDPADMSGTGSWTNDLTTQGTPIGDAVALGDYFGQLVVFGDQGMMFWQVDPDPDLNQYLRTVSGSVFAPRTITGYSDGDILFLDRSGVRSLQARDSSNQARVSDIGSPIDSEIRDLIAPDGNDTDPLFGQIAPEVQNSLFYNLATGIVHRDTGHFWMALREKVYVLSRYPSAKVLAWAEFDLPSPSADAGLAGPNKAGWVADWCPIGDSVVLRNLADEVYVYGGSDGDTYDDAQVEIITPFMDFGRPGSTKNFNGIDIVCDGEWLIEFSTEYRGNERDVFWAPVAEVIDGTRDGAKLSMDATGTQIALRLTSRSEFKAKVSELVIHYIEGNQK